MGMAINVWLHAARVLETGQRPAYAMCRGVGACIFASLRLAITLPEAGS
jgi:hypothetical protein